MLDKLDESNKSLDTGEKAEEMKTELLKIGFKRIAADFLIDHELNIASITARKVSLKDKILKNVGMFWRCPKIKYPSSNYFEHRIIRIIYAVVSHPTFHLFIFVSIILNTVILCFDYYDINGSFERPAVFEYFNYTFMGIFTVEVILKMIGFGCKEFVKDRFNLFDTVVVLFSILELLLSDGSGATSALRAFRLFRIFKIFRVGNLRIMLDSLSQTIMSIGNYVVLLLLFIYVFALMGMQFFAGKIRLDADGNPDSNGKTIRYNFDTIDVTFITIFNLLIGDNWNDTMYDAMRSVSAFSAVYFITIVIIGTLVMINLLIAIIINNFDNSRHYSNKRRMIEELKKYVDAGKDTFESTEIILGEKVALKAFGLLERPKPILRKVKKKLVSRSKTTKNISNYEDIKNYK